MGHGRLRAFQLVSHVGQEIILEFDDMGQSHPT